MTAVMAFLVGLIFALGLGISQMTQPQKILAFLDISGPWDPSLLYVMLGAVGIHMIAYPFILGRGNPIFAEQFKLPEKREMSKSLIFGSLLFGIGWGIAGYCPGPALTSLVTLDSRVGTFVVFMILGMAAYQWIESKLDLD